MSSAQLLLLCFAAGLSLSEGLITSYYQYRIADSVNCPQVAQCRAMRLAPPWQRLCRLVVCRYHQNLPQMPDLHIRDMRSVPDAASVHQREASRGSGLLSALIGDSGDVMQDKGADVSGPRRAKRWAWPDYADGVALVDDAMLPDWPTPPRQDAVDWLGALDQSDSVTKRHWANPVVACLKSRCAGMEGDDKLQCVIRKCHKATADDKKD